jgi:hypothetical protein
MCTIALMGTKSIRIHNAPTALIAQAKAAATMQGVTLREWIMDAMQTRLEDAPNGDIGLAPEGTHAAVTGRWDTVHKPIMERAVESARVSHDPKTCRIYGCLVCKEMD